MAGIWVLMNNGNGNYIRVDEGWNYISIPKLSENMLASYLLPTAVSQVYYFNGSGYQIVDILQNGKGYIVQFSFPQYIFIDGESVSSPIQVLEGWNLIGPFDKNIPISQVYSIPSGIITSDFFEFNGQSYLISNILGVGKGYWVKVTSDGIINLNGGSLSKDEGKQLAQIDKDWGRITITDYDDKSITLYTAEDQIESDFYELPPTPPSGIFDARYSSGRFVEALSSEKIIQISSDKYPITIKAEGINITVRDRISGDILNEELNNGEEISITNNNVTSIEVIGTITGELPITYELYQNYPNPFNPETTIKFAIPKESKVNLSIYNVLGELVSTLVNEQKKPGYYEYELDAPNLASGVYLYRIKSGDFVETKKMILLK